MSEEQARRPHAALDVAGRQPKAEKIRKLLALDEMAATPLRLLEIGTGSGAIAGYFATLPDIHCDVDSVDVLDQRQVFDSYHFQLVAGVDLPFEDGQFDVVISNHVLEHVGAVDHQLGHLREIARVLKPAGVAYLASPNRWQVVEPHYHLAFLSWLPRRLRSPYLAWSGKGNQYDCEPLSRAQIERMLRASGLEYRNVCVPALRCMLDGQRTRSPAARMAGWLPDAVLEYFRSVCPTHVYLLRRRSVDS